MFFIIFGLVLLVVQLALLELTELLVLSHRSDKQVVSCAGRGWTSPSASRSTERSWQHDPGKPRCYLPCSRCQMLPNRQSYQQSEDEEEVEACHDDEEDRLVDGGDLTSLIVSPKAQRTMCSMPSLGVKVVESERKKKVKPKATRDMAIKMMSHRIL